MSDKPGKVPRKLRFSGNSCKGLANNHKEQTKVPQYFWDCSRDSEIIKFFILEVSLVWHDVRGMPRIIKKMTDFWRKKI